MSMRRALHIHDSIIYPESVSSNDPFDQQKESDSFSNNDVFSFVLDLLYFWIIMGISILEMINELRNGRIRHKINQILERIQHLRLHQPETIVPLQGIQQQQQQQPIRRSRRVRKQVDRLNL